MMGRNLIEVFSNCYGPFGVREAVRQAAAAGIGFVELAMKAHDMGGLKVPADKVIGEASSEEDIASFEQLLKETGVRIITANGGGDLEKREDVEVIKKRIDLAHRLGARTFVVSCPTRSHTVYDNLQEIGDYALRRGVVIALETHPPLVTNAETGLETMRAVNHRNVRINFDTANIHYYNENVDTLAEMEKLLEYIVHVHLKDSRKGYKEWYFPAIGEGTIDMPAIFKRMNEVGFYGPFSLELEGIQGEGELTLEQRQARIVKSMEYLRQIGAVA